MTGTPTLTPMLYRPPQALLFDLDGTLIDSVGDLTAAANYIRAQYDQAPLSEDLVRTYIGDGARTLLKRALDVPPHEIDAAMRQFRGYYRDHCAEATTVYEGVVDTLNELREIPMAVVTNKPDDITRVVLDELGLSPLLPVVVGARKGVPVKPDPIMVQMALTELGADSARSWMVGDSTNDVQSGRAAGCGTVAVTYGIGDVTAVEAEHPDATIDSFADLLGLVG